MSRRPTPEEFCHERLAESFESQLSLYDTLRRVEVLTGDFLEDVRGQEALDVGCGLGYMSEALVGRGARVTACDIGPRLLEATRRRAGCRAVEADALALEETFGAERFDLVVSSECIEHTPDPDQAIRQMAGVLRPGGTIALSTPNRIWYPVVRAATLARLRPFDGHENFSSWGRLRATLAGSGVRVLREKGLHLFPFQIGLHRLSRWCDNRLQPLRGLMINLCVLGRKEGGPAGPPGS